MRAVLVTATDEIAVDDVARPDPSGRTLVRPEIAGLCGTDLKILHGTIPVTHPMILGHEIVGRVERAGPRGLVADGTRVLVNPTSWCGHCRLCLSDRAHLCPNGALLGRDTDGGFAELLAVDEMQLHPIPHDLPAQDASLLQVLGTCVHAQALVDVFPGQTAVVVGLGVAGLLHLQLLRARGLRTVIGVTRSAWKRELAEDLGATATAHPDDADEVVAEHTHGAGADLVVEAVGKVATLAQAIELAAVGGRLLVFGTITGADAAALPFYDLYFKELDVVNARAARPRDYAAAVDLGGSGVLRLAPLWSASYPLEDAPKAFAAVEGPDTLKVTLEMGG